MKFKKEIIASLFILASTNIFAQPEQTIIHITPELLAAQQGIALPWNVTPSSYDFDFENETNAPIKISLQVTTAKYAPNTSVYLFSTGTCGLTSLQPKQSIDCVIPPEGHLELNYNLSFFLENAEPISGTFTLSK